MNVLYSIKLNVGETLTASRLATRARITAHAKARARTEVSPNPFNTTRTNVLPPVHTVLSVLLQYMQNVLITLRQSRWAFSSSGSGKRNTSETESESYRFANPRWHKLAFDPLPGGSLCLIAGGLVFSSEVYVNGTYYKQLTYE